MSGDIFVAAVNRLRLGLAKSAARAGYDRLGSIPAAMTFRQWVDDLGAKGLKVDGLPFTLNDRPALAALYDAIPTTIEDARRCSLAVMKGAQMGMTVWEMLADIYMALKFEPAVIGMFLPSRELAADKSDRRFMRVLRTIPTLYDRLVQRMQGDAMTKIGEGNKLTRVMGESTFLFLWTTSATQTESRPMDILSFDEVQEMDLADIDRTMERMSASRIRYTLLLSTANVPERDIHYWFLQGTQNAWHTMCGGCGRETDLSLHWAGPNGRMLVVDYNTGQHPGAPMNDWVYICPHCKAWIPDPQRGRFIELNPGAGVVSYHYSQIISPTITPRDMAEAWRRADTGDRRKSFFNRKLGRPYVDPEQMPLTMADCLAASAEGVRLGLKWQTSGQCCYMGIDQMGSFNCVIIKTRHPDGRQAVVHIEAVYDHDPFARCDVLMKQYDVAMCVVEQLPNANDARRFANRWRGRVFLADYAGDYKADMIVWGDQVSRSDRKTAEEDRSRYQVRLQQYKAMQSSLHRIKELGCVFPDPAGLEAEWRVGVERKTVLLLRDAVYVHFTRTALVVEEDDDTRNRRAKVVKLGMDPHWSFANMLCDVAWSRAHGTGVLIVADSKADHAADELAMRNPGLPVQVVEMVRAGSAPETCGACTNCRAGACEERGFTVGLADPACDFFIPTSHG